MIIQVTRRTRLTIFGVRCGLLHRDFYGLPVLTPLRDWRTGLYFAIECIKYIRIARYTIIEEIIETDYLLSLMLVRQMFTYKMTPVDDVLQTPRTI